MAIVVAIVFVQCTLRQLSITAMVRESFENIIGCNKSSFVDQVLLIFLY